MERIRFRFILLFVFAFAPGFAFAGEGVVEFVPAGAEYVVGVNAESLRKLSLFRELTGERSEAGEVLTQFEQDYNLRFTDCRELLFVGGGSRLRGLLAGVSIPEAELARRLRGFGNRFSLEGEAGRRLYCIRSVPAENRRLRAIAPDGDPLVWSYVDLKSILSKSKQRSSGGFGSTMFKGVNHIFAELNVIGDGEFWRLDATARCVDAKSAQQFAFAVPGFLHLGASLLFSDNPVLGREFLQKLKIMPDGNRVILELAVSRAFAERLVRYLGEQAKKRIIPPDPVPRDIGTQRSGKGRD